MMTSEEALALAEQAETLAAKDPPWGETAEYARHMRAVALDLAAAVRGMVAENERLHSEIRAYEVESSALNKANALLTYHNDSMRRIIRTDLPDRASEAMERPATDDGKERG